MKLESTAFGRTGLSLPRMGLGLAALGRPGYITIGHAHDLAKDYLKDAMEGRTHRMLDLAYEKGIRYFDAARSYGQAEDFLLSWLKNGGSMSSDVHVGSKWGYIYTADWKVDADQHEVKEHSLANLERQWGKSKALLPHLKLYQIHSATYESGVLENKEVLSYLADLKANGMLIGLSISGIRQAELLEDAMQVRVDGQWLFDSAQVTYNLLERSAEAALIAAAESGMGLIIKEAVANGRLTKRNNQNGFEKNKALLKELAEKYHAGIDAIAYAFILSKPWAHLVLSGATVPAHLLSNLQAFRIELEAEDLEKLNQLAMPAEAYWEERSQLQWN